MFHRTVFQTVMTMLMSAMMALPAPSWARENLEIEEGQGDAKDGVPVILQEIITPDGKTAYFAIVPVPEADEQQVVAELARKYPDKLLLGVSDPGDPALKVALESSHLPWINSFLVADAGSDTLLEQAQLQPGLKEKLRAKIKQITEFCKREKQGLFTAAWVTGLATGFVMYESASVAAGMKAIVALGAWAVFQCAFSTKWEHALEAGGKLFEKAGTWIKRMFGRDVTVKESRAFDIAGQFHVSYLANMGVVGWVFFNANMLQGWTQVMWYAFLASTDIHDAHMAERKREGKITDIIFQRLIHLRIQIAAMFEVAAFLDIPYVQLSLASVTVGGLAYLALRSKVDDRVIRGSQKIKASAVKTRIKAREIATSQKQSCNQMLKNFSRKNAKKLGET